MSNPFRLSDDLIREALAPVAPSPVDDVVIGQLADAIHAEALTMPQERPSRLWRGVATGRGSRRFALAAAATLLLLGLLFALAIGNRPRPVIGDGSTFHGNAARTGVVAGPGPRLEPVSAWTVDLSGPLSNTQPALESGRLYVADGEGNVTVYDAATGAKGWTRRLAKPAGSPTVSGGVLVVGAGDGLFGLDVATGVERWRVPTSGAVRSAPAVVDGIAYAGFRDGSVIAVDAASGAERWRTAPAEAAITRAVAVADGVLYAGNDAGFLRAIDVADGTVRWERQVGPGALSSPAVEDGRVHVATGLDDPSAVHEVLTIDARTGAEQSVNGVAGGGVIGAVDRDVVYVFGRDGRVTSLRDGHERWAIAIGNAIGSVGTLSGDTLYVSVVEGLLVAVDVEQGTVLWQVEVDGDPGPVIVDGGRVYVGTDVGQLAAFGPATEPSP